MQLKRVFPDSLILDMKINSQTQERLWDISRQCSRFWNAALEQFRHPDSAVVGTRQARSEHISSEHPEFAGMAPSVRSRVLGSLDEAFELYYQGEKDYQAHRRPDMPVPPSEHKESEFFPLYFADGDLRFDQESNCLELHDGEDWIALPLPEKDGKETRRGEGPGLGHTIQAVLIMFHPDTQRIKVEINPILEDIKD